MEALDAVDVEHNAALTKRFSHRAQAEPLQLLSRRYVLEETPAELATAFARSPAALRMQLMRLRTLLKEGTRP
jgi:hypothetical protein